MKRRLQAVPEIIGTQSRLYIGVRQVKAWLGDTQKPTAVTVQVRHLHTCTCLPAGPPACLLPALLFSRQGLGASRDSAVTS